MVQEHAPTDEHGLTQSKAIDGCAEGREWDDSPDRPLAGPTEGPRDRAYERADIHPLVCVISRTLPPRTARRGESSASAVHRTAATSWLECPFPVMLCARNRCARLRLGTIRRTGLRPVPR